MPLRAAIYARQSLDATGEGLAVERQTADCKALAAARGWQVTQIIADNSISASTGKERPGYTQVLDLMRARAVDVIVVWHIDRLARRMLDLERLVELAEASDVRIATVSGDLDLSTDAGRLVARILAAVARAEVERKGARQRRANLQRRTAGISGWTVRPFGYDHVLEPGGPRVFVVEAEARYLRDIAAGIIAGDSLASWARVLNDAGAVTTAGNPWRPFTLRRTLMSPRYAGRVPYAKADTGTAGRWPAIFDDDTHAALVEKLNDPGRRTAPSTTLRHWLSGTLSCGVEDCTQKLYSTKSNGELAYRCRTGHLSRAAALVDEVLSTALLMHLGHPRFTAAFLGDDQLAKLREKAAQLRERRDAITGMLGEGLVTPAAARGQLQRIAEDLSAAQAALSAAEASSPVALLTATDDEAQRRRLFDEMPVALQRRLWDDVVERCAVLPVRAAASYAERAAAFDLTWR